MLNYKTGCFNNEKKELIDLSSRIDLTKINI